MIKYRFKTEQEFKDAGLWEISSYPHVDHPRIWNNSGSMNRFIGQEIDPKFNSVIEKHLNGQFKGPERWTFSGCDIELIEPELSPEELQEQINQIKNQNSLINKKQMKKAVKNSVEVNVEKFVFMDKTADILNIGYSTCKNVVLYGPGGHGKSEMTLDFLKQRGIDPYVITMGTGMTTDRLFGGLDIAQLRSEGGSGRIEYLVENSFMNHEYVVFEEMFDAPDFILEQLKDILSSGVFRNGTQVFPIKTKFIICCTNRTRDEFSKNMSLKALTERFPLELNVVWDNYTETSYNKLLESKFGVDNVDPVIPYLLQEYAKNSIIISPRIAVTAYQVYDQCGPESLSYIAEFSKKPSLIAEAIKKFESTIKFRELSEEITELVGTLSDITTFSKSDDAILKQLKHKLSDIKGMTVSDDIVSIHAQVVKIATATIKKVEKSIEIASFL